jgi:hypothetical protein
VRVGRSAPCAKTEGASYSISIAQVEGRDKRDGLALRQGS